MLQHTFARKINALKDQNDNASRFFKDSVTALLSLKQKHAIQLKKICLRYIIYTGF